MKKQQIRESIYKLLEEQTKFQPGDTVSTSKDGEGSIVLSKHPYYSVKLESTGVTKSYHFSELQEVEPTESEFGKYDIGNEENSQENELDKELDGLQEIKINKPKSTTLFPIKINSIEELTKITSILRSKGFKPDWDIYKGSYPVYLYGDESRFLFLTNNNNDNKIYRLDNINESPSDKIVKFDGILNIHEGEYLTDILSDIRSLQGVTIVKNEDIVNEDLKTKLRLKVDPYPFGDQGEQKIISYLIKKIKQIPGVRDFQKIKHTEQEKTTPTQFKSPTPVKSIEDLLKENKIRLKKSTNQRNLIESIITQTCKNLTESEAIAHFDTEIFLEFANPEMAYDYKESIPNYWNFEDKYGNQLEVRFIPGVNYIESYFILKDKKENWIKVYDYNKVKDNINPENQLVGGTDDRRSDTICKIIRDEILPKYLLNKKSQIVKLHPLNDYRYKVFYKCAEVCKDKYPQIEIRKMGNEILLINK